MSDECFHCGRRVEVGKDAVRVTLHGVTVVFADGCIGIVRRPDGVITDAPSVVWQKAARLYYSLEV